MVELLLLDPFTGRQTKTGGKTIPAKPNAEKYLNILLLFVDYNAPSLTLDADQISIVKKLYGTLPFNKQRHLVNVFTPRSQPNLGVIHPPLTATEDQNVIVFKKSIKNIVKTYSYKSFIKNGSVWLNNKPLISQKRSEGCVCIISGSNKRLGFALPYVGIDILPVFGQEEIQTLTRLGTVSGGTYTLSLTHKSATAVTEAIAFDADAATVQAALLKNSGTATAMGKLLKSGDVVVTGTPATALTLTYGEKLNYRDVALIVVDDTLITGGGTIKEATTQSGKGDWWNGIAVPQKIAFSCLAYPHGVANDRSKYLPANFMHELGHLLNLDEEYESNINRKNDGIWRRTKIPEFSFREKNRPNVISKLDLLKDDPFNPLSKAYFDGDFPAELDIDIKKVPWEARMILTGGIQGIAKHKLRSITQTQCTQNGRSYNHLYEWCEDPNLISITGLLPSQIGLVEGGSAKSLDVFRPYLACRMRVRRQAQADPQYANQAFCLICRDWITYRITSDNYNQDISAFKIWHKIYVRNGN